MVVHSLSCRGGKWIDVEVELTLLPGLPVVHFLGDAARELRESGPKLKAAFVNQGLEWPRTRQIVFNIRAGQVNVGREVELAAAAALARETEQIGDSALLQTGHWVGELSLAGEIRLPRWPLPPPEGGFDIVSAPGGGAWVVEGLAQLKSPLTGAAAQPLSWRAPDLADLWLSPSQAQLAAVAAAGEHHLLLAGPPGTGKTTLVEVIHGLLADFDADRAANLIRAHQLMGEQVHWRPLISPHHTSPPVAILGGGMPPEPGEVSRAHGGILFLDEYLEFSPRVQEALREPAEKGAIRLARGSHATVFQADFMLIAATNLCPCGRMAPGRRNQCGLSLNRCQSRLAKLSGPMLDRFQLIGLSHEWAGERSVSVFDIRARVVRAGLTRRGRGQERVNRHLSSAEVMAQLASGAELALPTAFSSERRRRAILSVARTLADLDGAERVGIEHISGALPLADWPIRQLAQSLA